MAVIDSIVKQAGDARKPMDWYRRKVRDATGSGTTARGLIRQGKATASWPRLTHKRSACGESWGLDRELFTIRIPCA